MMSASAPTLINRLLFQDWKRQPPTKQISSPKGVLFSVFLRISMHLCCCVECQRYFFPLKKKCAKSLFSFPATIPPPLFEPMPVFLDATGKGLSRKSGSVVGPTHWHCPLVKKSLCEVSFSPELKYYQSFIFRIQWIKYEIKAMC